MHRSSQRITNRNTILFMKYQTLLTKNLFVFAFLLLCSIVVYSFAFSADYLYLDEAFQLWHRSEDVNFTMFANQGRLPSGILAQKLWKAADTIAAVKYIRVFTLMGWTLTSGILFCLSKKWVRHAGLDQRLPFLLAVFCLCSNYVAIYIGWSNFQTFPAFIAGLFAGHLLWQTVTRIPGVSNAQLYLKASLATLLGVTSLSFYQVCFGIFLLPFLLSWIGARTTKTQKQTVTAVIVYLLTYGVYFLFFKFYLSILDIPASDRTSITFNPLKNIAFFFSTPFSQSWNLNLLQDAHSVPSQLFPFVLFGIWLFLFIKRSPKTERWQGVINLVLIFGLLFLSYLPAIIAKENFSSYRTMVALNTSVFVLFISYLFLQINREIIRDILATILIVSLVIIGYWNYNTNFAKPLSKEFNAISDLPIFRTGSKDTIIMIRPDLQLFKRLYGISQFKDEFGIPSTYRDWTPEPLIRQLIAEHQSQERAEKVVVYHFTDVKAYQDSLGNTVINPEIIDVNELLKKK